MGKEFPGEKRLTSFTDVMCGLSGRSRNNAIHCKARAGKGDENHLIATVLSVKWAGRSLLRVNKGETVGKEWC